MSQENYSPYCPICSACGEDGCCSALCCQQHPDGDYCETYLKELRFGYALNKQFYKELYNKLSKELQEECDKIWEETYDNIFKSDEEDNQLA